MFKKGEFVVYEAKGLCEITDITELDLGGAIKGRKYYVLKPVYDEGGTIYSAVDNAKVTIRRMITRQEAEEILSEIPEIKSLKIPDEKQRENRYKEAMHSCDCRQWISMIKTLYVRRENRLMNGKKTTNTDDRYYKKAGDSLHGELAMAMGMDKSEMENIILGQINSELLQV